MSLISVCINVDTRSQKNQQEGLFAGVVNTDFLTDGVYNKIKFLDGFEKEVIVFIDKHEEIPESALSDLRNLADTLVIRKHTHEEKFNDWNYLNCLSLCRGDIIMHFDGDMAAFTPNKQSVEELLSYLDHYDFVSYPSGLSPAPDHNDNYDYWWCSTRFFICKRGALDITEIGKCLRNMDYLYGKYPASVKNPWLEHIVGLHAKYNNRKTGVYYPPIDYDKLLIWCWENYDNYILNRLNHQPYEEVKQFVLQKGGIFYPNNVKI